MTLVGHAPRGSRPVRLFAPKLLSGRAFEVCGFPTGNDAGVWAEGRTGHPRADGLVQVGDAMSTAYPIKAGFIGAPVWDVVDRGVLGMVVAFERDVQTKVAFMYPVHELSKVVPLAVVADPVAADPLPETLESVGQLDDAEQIGKHAIREAPEDIFEADYPEEELAPENEPAKSDVEREHVSWLDDDPVDLKADELGRQGVARALEDQLRTLVKDYPRRSFLVHIDGPWGAGKSTLMRFVQERVAEGSDASGAWLVVSYDAWRQANAGPPWLTLLEAIRTAVRAQKGTPLGRVSFWLRERARLVAQWQWIAAGLIVAALLSVAFFFFYATSSFTLTKWGDVLKLAGGLLPVIAVHNTWRLPKEQTRSTCHAI